MCVCIWCFFSFQLTSGGTAQRPACSAAERMACCLVTFDPWATVCVCVWTVRRVRASNKQRPVSGQIATSQPQSNSPADAQRDRERTQGIRWFSRWGWKEPERRFDRWHGRLTVWFEMRALVRRGEVCPRGQSVATLLICWFDLVNQTVG